LLLSTETVEIAIAVHTVRSAVGIYEVVAATILVCSLPAVAGGYLIHLRIGHLRRSGLGRSGHHRLLHRVHLCRDRHADTRAAAAANATTDFVMSKSPCAASTRVGISLPEQALPVPPFIVSAPAPPMTCRQRHDD